MLVLPSGGFSDELVKRSLPDAGPEPTRSIDDVVREDMAYYSDVLRKLDAATKTGTIRPQFAEKLRAEVHARLGYAPEPTRVATKLANWAPTTRWAFNTLKDAAAPDKPLGKMLRNPAAVFAPAVAAPSVVRNPREALAAGMRPGEAVNIGLAALALGTGATAIQDAALVPWRGALAAYEGAREGSSPLSFGQRYNQLLNQNSSAQQYELAQREAVAPRWVAEQQAAGVPESTIQSAAVKQLMALEGAGMDLLSAPVAGAAVGANRLVRGVAKKVGDARAKQVFAQAADTVAPPVPEAPYTVPLKEGAQGQLVFPFGRKKQAPVRQADLEAPAVSTPDPRQLTADDILYQRWLEDRQPPPQPGYDGPVPLHPAEEGRAAAALADQNAVYDRIPRDASGQAVFPVGRFRQGKSPFDFNVRAARRWDLGKPALDEAGVQAELDFSKRAPWVGYSEKEIAKAKRGGLKTSLEELENRDASRQPVNIFAGRGKNIVSSLSDAELYDKLSRRLSQIYEEVPNDASDSVRSAVATMLDNIESLAEQGRGAEAYAKLNSLVTRSKRLPMQAQAQARLLSSELGWLNDLDRPLNLPKTAEELASAKVGSEIDSDFGITPDLAKKFEADALADQTRALDEPPGMGGKLYSNPFDPELLKQAVSPAWKATVKKSFPRVFKAAASSAKSVDEVVRKYIPDPVKQRAALDAMAEDIAQATEAGITGSVGRLKTSTTTDVERFGPGTEQAIRDVLKGRESLVTYARTTLSEIERKSVENGYRDLARTLREADADDMAAATIRAFGDGLGKIQALSEMAGQAKTAPDIANVLRATGQFIEQSAANDIAAGTKMLSQAGTTLRAARDMRELVAAQTITMHQKLRDVIQQIPDLKQRAAAMKELRRITDGLLPADLKAGVPELIYHYWRNSLISGVMTRAMAALNIPVQAIVKPIERALEAVADAGVSAVTGSPRTYYMREVPAQTKALFEFLAQGKRMQDKYKTRTPASPDFAKRRTPFGIRAELAESPAAAAAWRRSDAIISEPERYMGALDEFTKAMAGYMEQQSAVARRAGKALTDADITGIQREQARRALQDSLGRVLVGIGILRSSVPGVRYVQPFLHTVGAILQGGIERNMFFQAANIVSKSVPKLRKSGYSRAIISSGEDFQQAGRMELNRDLANLATGAALFAVAVSLYENGLVNGAAPTNADERAGWERQGRRPYTIRIGDTYYPILSAVEPYGTALMSYIAMLDTAKKLEREPANSKTEQFISLATRTVMGVGEALISKQFLGGLNAALDTMTQKVEGPQEMAFLRKVGGGFVPSLSKDIAETIDPVRRKSTNVFQDVQKRIPIAREGLPVARDPYGEPVPSGRKWYTLGLAIHPARDQRPEDRVLSDVRIPSLPEAVSGVPIPPEQRDTLEQQYGTLMKTFVQRISATPQFARMSRPMKQDIINKVASRYQQAVLARTKAAAMKADPYYASPATRRFYDIPFNRSQDYRTRSRAAFPPSSR